MTRDFISLINIFVYSSYVIYNDVGRTGVVVRQNLDLKVIKNIKVFIAYYISITCPSLLLLLHSSTLIGLIVSSSI